MADMNNYGKGGTSPEYGTNYGGGVGYCEVIQSTTTEIPNYDYYIETQNLKGFN